MARQVNRAESWERIHEVFTQVNFNAFDYNTIKESLLDYLKLYYPEDFSDYIESSEFIALLELFAYVGELLAYRLDINAHENFITTAERKESILRLAKLISYKASRNIPARGLVKMTSISTTENIIDSAGRNLVGRRIYWNDANNPDWKEQFILIMNRALEQEFGTVTPDERVQVNDVLFELYTFDNSPFGTSNAANISFSADAGGTTAPMEVVPIQLTDDGPEERRPEQNAKFSLTYASDGLGDGSDTTGFLMFLKQGTLQQQIQNFDGVTPNQTHDISISDINETDLWINNINPNSGTILTDDPYKNFFPHLVSEDLRYGEWIEVDLANAQNIIFNTNRNRHKYEVETLDNDQVRIVFGDGEFSDIPSGMFQLWYRTSLNQDYIVEKSSIINQPTSISYTDVNGNVQSLTFTFSLVSSLLNASASEDIEHIRRTAPSVYYTQDRMVNGRDYNTFMLQNPSILKLRAINRTFAGDSKYIAWHDPRESYEDVKLFGDDMALYWVEEEPDNGSVVIVPEGTSEGEILENYIEPQLSGTDFFAVAAPRREALGFSGGGYKTEFSNSTYVFGSGVDPTTLKDDEVESITYALGNLAAPLYLWYSAKYDEWLVSSNPTADPFDAVTSGDRLDADAVLMFKLGKLPNDSWEIYWRTKRLIAQSSTTKFWNSNTTERVVNFDTLNSQLDNIVILKANVGYSDSVNAETILSKHHNFSVIAQELTDTNSGNLPDIQRLSVLPEDVNGDGIADDLEKAEIFNLSVSDNWSNLRAGTGPSDNYIDISGRYGRKINNSETKGLDHDVKVYKDGVPITYTGDLAATTDLIMDRLYINNIIGDPIITISFIDHVYFTRADSLSTWEPVELSDEIRLAYISEDDVDDVTFFQDEQRYDRREGRYPLNFLWQHYTTSLNLVDPAASNIIDIYIITKGYYEALTRWLENRSDVQPDDPTPLDLRSSYSDLLDNKMISDTVVLHPGRFKILFGSRAIPQLRAIFKVIRPDSSSLTDNQVKARMVNIVRTFFDIETWEFGESFFFTELAASIHADLGPEIDSVVLVPEYSQNQFGDLFQVFSKEDELFIPHISTTDIEIVQSYTASNIRQN